MMLTLRRLTMIFRMLMMILRIILRKRMMLMILVVLGIKRSHLRSTPASIPSISSTRLARMLLKMETSSLQRSW